MKFAIDQSVLHEVHGEMTSPTGTNKVAFHHTLKGHVINNEVKIDSVTLRFDDANGNHTEVADIPAGLIEGLGNAVFQINRGERSHYTYSSQACPIHGYDAQEVAGKCASCFPPVLPPST